MSGEGSKKFTLDMTDVMSLVKNALLVGGAAAVTFIMQNLGSLDLGDMGALLVPVIAVVLDTVVKWFKDNTEVPVKE
jgi:hypothetical protein